MDPKQALLRKIQRVRERWNRFIWLRGLSWILGIGVAALVLAMTIAEASNIPPWLVVILRVGLFLTVVATIVIKLIFPLLNRPSDQQLARFVEEKHQGLQDRLVSAVEFVRKPSSEHGPFGILLIRDALDRTRNIRLDDVVNRRKLNTFTTLSVAFSVALIVAVYFSTLFFPYGSARLFAGFLEPPTAPTLTISVTPGDTTVPRGTDVVLEAITAGFDPERAEVHLRYENSSQWEASTMEVTPLIIPTFRHLLFNVQEPIRYFVQASGYKSTEFVIQVADLPRVESLDYTYHYPQYTGLPTRTEEDALDMVAISGTGVDLMVHANQELTSGRLIFSDGREIDLTPSTETGATARLTIEKSGTFRVELTNTRDQKYLGLEEYAMEALDDQKPLIEFAKPGRDYKASTVEEIFTELHAEDDLGIHSLELYFSVNGAEEEKIDLFTNNSRAPKEISGSYTFFLEEHELQPGDFITYYGQAVDSSHVANSVMTDIYFIEVRPFDREYFQTQTGGQAGGGQRSGRDDSAEALSRRQKEIIAATFNLIRDKESFSVSEYSDNIQAVADSQSTLAEQTQTLMTRLMRRQLVVQERIGQLSEYMRIALGQMGPAAQELREEDLDGALPYEQKALQFLMRAETLFNQIQISRGQSGSGGMGSTAEDLADLFDLELDQNKNQYETLQRGELSRNSQELDEALRRLQEIAERQQKMIEQQRRQARMGGGDGGIQQMSADELRRETQRLARQLDRLSRENNDRQMADVSRALEGAARNMQQSRNRPEQLQREAAERALKELELAQRLLASAQGGSLDERLANLRRQAEMLADQQTQIAGQTERLVADQNSDTKRQTEQLRDLKEEAIKDLRSLEEGLESIRTNQESRETASRIRSAANSIRSGRLLDKMNQGQQLLDNGYFNYAAQRERELEKAFGDLARQLGDAVSSAANTEERQVQNALNQTSEAIRRLESMQRRMKNEQQDRQQSKQGTSGPGAGESVGGFRNGGVTTRGTREEDARQLTREWEQRLRDVQDIRDQLDRNNLLRGDLNRLMDAIRRQMEHHYPGDPTEIEALRREIIDPFRSIELELSRELQLLIGKENIRSAHDEEIPAGYKRLVEEYYKKLSNEHPGPNNN